MHAHPTIFALAVALLTSAFAASAADTFTDRSTFSAAAGPLLTDDYESPAYALLQTDAQMSAVLGLTRYTATGFANKNKVLSAEQALAPGAATGTEHTYCAGCNGSFELDFTAASLGGNGVHSFGFDYANQDGDLTARYVAFVTFADGSRQNFDLQTAAFNVPLPVFFGITSLNAITRVHIGLTGGLASTEGFFTLDKLSVSAPGPEPTPVPEPGSLALLALGLSAIAFKRRRLR